MKITNGSHYTGVDSAHHVIVGSRVTEKTTFLSDQRNCVVLQVAVGANKFDIRAAVEAAWSVRVVAVRTQMRIGKSRRRGAQSGYCADRKFAIVQLHADDRLSFY